MCYNKRMTNDVIILLGLKHSGKSTLGKKLAEKKGYGFTDTDALIEKMTGMNVRDLYNQKGAAAFMEAEENVCLKLSGKFAGGMVISTGGGICDNPPALVHLKGMGRFVFLENDLNLSVMRIVKKIDIDENGKFTNVPAFIRSQNPETLVDIKKMLRAKFEERAELYKKISDITVQLEDTSIEENLAVLLNAVE